MFDLPQWVAKYMASIFYERKSRDWHVVDDGVIFHVPMPLKLRPHRMSRGIFVSLSPAVRLELMQAATERQAEIGERSKQSVQRWFEALEFLSNHFLRQRHLQPTNLPQCRH